MTDNEPDSGAIGIGLGLGCLTQLAMIFVSYLVLWRAHIILISNMGLFISSGWSIIQWIILIPIIMNQRGKGKTKTAQGLIICGCVAVLLSSACGFTAWSMFHQILNQ